MLNEQLIKDIELIKFFEEEKRGRADGMRALWLECVRLYCASFLCVENRSEWQSQVSHKGACVGGGRYGRSGG